MREKAVIVKKKTVIAVYSYNINKVNTLEQKKPCLFVYPVSEKKYQNFFIEYNISI